MNFQARHFALRNYRNQQQLFRGEQMLKELTRKQKASDRLIEHNVRKE
jgi:hypothetical protein